MSKLNFNIGKIEIGEGKPCFIIAELSANHAGSIEIAKKTILAAKEAGADAIKLQTFTPDTITLNSKKKEFLINHGTQWDGQYLYELYEKTHLPWSWHKELFDTAKNEGLVCFSSPFDFTAVDFLEELEAPAYKIASPEIVDTSLVKHCAQTGKPIIISTGIATISDIELAVQCCREAKNDKIALLKCTTAYPAPIEKANLKTIPCLQNTFNVIPGLSDHTLGIVAPVVAVTLGAKVIEKHFTLDKSIKSADSSFSLDKEEFAAMTSAVRQAERSMGKVHFEKLGERENLSKLASRSLFVVIDVKKGDLITEENVKSIRPGNGLHPKHFEKILGKSFQEDIEKGTPLSWSSIAE